MASRAQRDRPVLTNRTIWLKAFDVDDVTREDFDAGVIDPNWRAGNDNYPDYL